MELPGCFLCNRDTILPWFVKRVGNTDYPIVRCNSCKSAYVWPRPNPDSVKGLYTDRAYDPGHNRKCLYWPSGRRDAARLLKSFAPFIKGWEILDIGAGVGVATEEAMRRGFTVRACEPSPQCRKEFLDRNGFEPDPRFFDSEYAEENRHQVDVVLLSHVLEHLSDPQKILNELHIVLQSGGVVIIAVPLFGSVLTSVMGRRDFFISPPEHLTYFSHEGLRKLLERNGFRVEAEYTSSKVNMSRYRNQLGPFCYALNMTAYMALRCSELFERSVVLNLCARRIS